MIKRITLILVIALSCICNPDDPQVVDYKTCLKEVIEVTNQGQFNTIINEQNYADEAKVTSIMLSELKDITKPLVPNLQICQNSKTYPENLSKQLPIDVIKKSIGIIISLNIDMINIQKIEDQRMIKFLIFNLVAIKHQVSSIEQVVNDKEKTLSKKAFSLRSLSPKSLRYKKSVMYF